MKNFKCPEGCCEIKISNYIKKKHSENFFKKGNKKAGVFIYDPKKNKVLLVQSRGNLWGIPKGTLEYGETERICAIREVKEETGLEISEGSFIKSVKIYNNAEYFYIHLDECEVKVQKHIIGNDANGIGWIKPSCLEKFIKNGNISVNKHCRLVFKKFQNLDLPEANFVDV